MLGLVVAVSGCATHRHSRRNDDRPRRPRLSNITERLDGFAESDANNPDRAVAAFEAASKEMLVHIENNDLCVHADGADTVSDGATPRRTALRAIGGEVHVSTGAHEEDNKLGIVALKPEPPITAGMPVVFWGVSDGKRASVTAADGSRFICDVASLKNGAEGWDKKALPTFSSIAGKRELTLRAEQGFLGAVVAKNLAASASEFSECAARIWTKAQPELSSAHAGNLETIEGRVRKQVYSACGGSIDRFGAVAAEANRAWSTRRKEIRKRGLSKLTELE